MRRRWFILAAALAALGATGVALLGPFGEEAFPLADRVPADALVYVGLPDGSLIDRLPEAWTESFRADLREARPFLAGGLAVYLDREGEWVALARLRRGSALMADERVALDGNAAVIARSPAALRRHRERTAALADDPVFRSLGRRIYVNLQALRLPGRLGDFSAVGCDVESGPPWKVSGTAIYRRGLRRLYLDRYVHRARVGGVEGDGCARTHVMLDAGRLLGEITGALSDEERDGVAHYLRTLSEELLAGEPFESFLDRIGPGVEVRVVAGDPPGAAIRVDLADGATRDRVEQLLRRCIPDIQRLGTRDKGLPYVKVTAFEDPLWRLEFPRLADWNLGPSFDPVCTFEGHSFVLASRPDLLPVPAPSPGEAHVTVSLDVEGTLAAWDWVDRRAPGRLPTRRVPPALRSVRRIILQGRYTGEGLIMRAHVETN